MANVPSAMDSFTRELMAGPQAVERRQQGSQMTIAQAAALNTQAIEQLAQALTELVQRIEAPKRVVYGPDGRAVAVVPETGEMQ